MSAAVPPMVASAAASWPRRRGDMSGGVAILSRRSGAGREGSGVFSRPTDADRERRRVDLINRARLVRAHGWDDSAGRSRHSRRVRRESANGMGRWAFDLWGLADGQADVDDNCSDPGGSSTQQVQCE